MIDIPGVLTHLTVGIIIFVFSSLILKKIYNAKYTRLNLFLLGGVCIVFCIVPDFPLGLYYALGLFQILSEPYIIEAHLIISFGRMPARILDSAFIVSDLSVLFRRVIYGMSSHEV